MNDAWAAPLKELKNERHPNVQTISEDTPNTATKNSSVENPSTKEISISKKIAINSTTIRLQRTTRPMDEYEAIQVEEYLLRHETLRRGVSDSMNIIDSSANVLHSQMSDLLKVEADAPRKPGEWATQLASQCGKTIAELIRAKTDAMRLLK